MIDKIFRIHIKFHIVTYVLVWTSLATEVPEDTEDFEKKIGRKKAQKMQKLSPQDSEIFIGGLRGFPM